MAYPATGRAWLQVTELTPFHPGFVVCAHCICRDVTLSLLGTYIDHIPYEEEPEAFGLSLETTKARWKEHREDDFMLPLQISKASSQIPQAVSVPYYESDPKVMSSNCCCEKNTGSCKCTDAATCDAGKCPHTCKNCADSCGCTNLGACPDACGVSLSQDFLVDSLLEGTHV